MRDEKKQMSTTGRKPERKKKPRGTECKNELKVRREEETKESG